MTKRRTKKVRPEEEEALAESEGLSAEEKVVTAEVIESKPFVPPFIAIKYLGVADVYKVRGSVSGVEYTFTARSRVSFVATEDYEGLLQRVRPARRCCGGKTIPEQPYFGPVS